MLLGEPGTGFTQAQVSDRYTFTEETWTRDELYLALQRRLAEHFHIINDYFEDGIFHVCIAILLLHLNHLQCTLCSIVFGTPASLFAHLTTKRHKTKAGIITSGGGSKKGARNRTRQSSATIESVIDNFPDSTKLSESSSTLLNIVRPTLTRTNDELVENVESPIVPFHRELHGSDEAEVTPVTTGNNSIVTTASSSTKSSLAHSQADQSDESDSDASDFDEWADEFFSPQDAAVDSTANSCILFKKSEISQYSHYGSLGQLVALTSMSLSFLLHFRSSFLIA